jgi:hypothetical protein
MSIRVQQGAAGDGFAAPEPKRWTQARRAHQTPHLPARYATVLSHLKHRCRPHSCEVSGKPEEVVESMTSPGA